MKIIGCCDSGLGGMLVVDALHKAYPNLDIMYVADQKNVPYGDKSVNELIELAKNMFQYFRQQGIKDVVVACNTLCANAVEKLRNDFPDLNIYSIIGPTCAQLEGQDYKKIGVLATKKTVESHAYLKKINKYCPQAEVFEVAAPKLVPIIESGCNYHELKKAVQEYCIKDIDAWVLGCTHFPYIRPILEIDYDLYDSNDAVINLFKDIEMTGSGNVSVYTTGNYIEMKKSIRTLLCKDYNVYPLVLEKLKIKAC